MNTMHELLKLASLEIIDHDIHTRSKMDMRDRVLPYYVMSYIKKGRAIVRVGEREYITEPGCIVLIPPYIKHDHYMIEECETLFFWWHFMFTVTNVIDIIRFLRLPMISALKTPDSFEATFLRYCQINRTEPTIANLLRRKAQAIEVLALILDDLIAENDIFSTTVPEPFPQILFDVMNTPDHELSLKFLSDKYHLAPTYISNRFKSYFGTPPIVMCRDFMLERAKQLLRSTGMPVGDVAAALGYGDIYSFSHYFTTKVGINPTAYRKSFI